MPVEFNLREIESLLPREDLTLIADLLDSSIRNARKYLPVDNFSVTCTVEPGKVLPHWGLVGFVPADLGRNRISVILDPDYPRYRDAEGRSRFSAVIAHECHHLLRFREVPYGATLAERLVAEGLALLFEEESGHPVFPDYRAVPESEVDRFAELAVPLLSERPDLRGHFGEGPDLTLPSWAVYDLGRAVVSEALAHDQVTPSAAVHYSTERIVDTWLALKGFAPRRMGALRQLAAASSTP